MAVAQTAIACATMDLAKNETTVSASINGKITIPQNVHSQQCTKVFRSGERQSNDFVKNIGIGGVPAIRINANSEKIMLYMGKSMGRHDRPFAYWLEIQRARNFRIDAADSRPCIYKSGRINTCHVSNIFGTKNFNGKSDPPSIMPPINLRHARRNQDRPVLQ